MSLAGVISNRRLWIAIAGLFLCVFLVARSGIGLGRYDDLNIQRGQVLDADNSRLQPDPNIEGLYIGVQTLEVALTTGDFSGQRFRIENTMSRFFNHMGTEGLELLFHVSERDGQVLSVEVFNHSRSTFMYVFAGLFALVLIAVGRMKGLYSVLSLAFTLSFVIFFMIPQVLDGRNPIVLAVITAAFTTVFSILLVNDFSKKSFAAIGGTIAGVAIAGAVGVAAGSFAHISGLHMEHAAEVMHQGGRDLQIRLPLLLFAGIIIASLGAVMDIGVSISSSIFEMKKVNPALGFRHLYKSGMNIGRDIIGTMSNTLILAFAGSSIMVMIIIAIYQLPYIRLINMNLLAVEVIQGLSASIALVLTVPITALFAAVLASEGRFQT